MTNILFHPIFIAFDHFEFLYLIFYLGSLIRSLNHCFVLLSPSFTKLFIFVMDTTVTFTLRTDCVCHPIFHCIETISCFEFWSFVVVVHQQGNQATNVLALLLIWQNCWLFIFLITVSFIQANNRVFWSTLHCLQKISIFTFSFLLSQPVGYFFVLPPPNSKMVDFHTFTTLFFIKVTNCYFPPFFCSIKPCLIVILCNWQDDQATIFLTYLPI